MENSPGIFIIQVVFFALLHPTDAQDRGVIFIGNSSTDLASEYLYRFEEIGVEQTIPIIAVVYPDGDTSQTGAKTEDITVVCSVLGSDGLSTEGYTGLSFKNLTLPAAEDTGSLTFTPQKVGRPASVQCAAQSVSGTCPIGTGTAQFCFDTSVSNIVTMRVLPSPTVTHCDLQKSVLDTTDTFTVLLSETATEDVTVTCTPAAGSTLSLTIPALTIPAGSTSGQVSFTVTSGDVGSTALVTCEAQSAIQFSAARSKVDASTALFTRGAFSLSFKPDFLKVYNTTTTSFLELKDTQTVSVACRAFTEPSIEQALATAATAPDCSLIDSDTSATTTPWRVQSVFFELQPQTGVTGEESFFRAVTTQRVELVTGPRSEVILTRCCVRGSPPRVAGLYATMITVAELAPFVCEGCNTTIEDPRQERVLQNPGYVEVAPCPCDLNQNACDFNCCCDEDCSTNERLRFSECLPGLTGGEPADPEEYRCSSKVFNLPDWHLMTCVYYENNAYLGQYFMNRGRVSETAFSSVVASKYKGRFSLSPASKVEASTAATSYTYGADVTTLREDILPGLPGSRGVLALNRPSPTGECEPNSPVKFLKAQKHRCMYNLTPDKCTPLSHFSARVYAISSSISGCSQSFKISSTLGSNTVVPTDVIYYCTDRPSQYTDNLDIGLSGLANELGANYGPDLDGVDCSQPCSSQNCTDYNRGKSAQSDSTRPELCDWDDGNTAPKVPTLTGGSSCENAVLGVKYIMEWSGSEITHVTAHVVLGIIYGVVDGLDNMISQEFEVEWVHKTNGSYSLSDNYLGTTEPYERSGSAGYELGTTLASGCAVYDSTSQEFQTVDTSEEKQMAIFKPISDGKCNQAKRQSVTFGDDSFSSCVLRLTAEDIASRCEDLQKKVWNHINVLMPASVIGRYGYNNPGNLEMWIPVTRQNLSEVEEEASAASNSSESFRTWADSITNRCRVVDSITLNVLWAQTGAVDGNPRREVVGAHVSFKESTWTVDCQGSLAVRCAAGSAIVQNFFLYSAVHFMEVDATSQSKETRFHTRCDPYDFAGSSSCERFFSHVYQGECYWEMCWHELMFPIAPGVDRGPDYDWRLDSLPVFLAMVLGIVGYVSVARPGWS